MEKYCLTSEATDRIKYLIQHGGFTEIPNDKLPNMFDIMDFNEIARGFSIEISNENIDTNNPWTVFVNFSDNSNGAASFDLENETDLYLVIDYWSADEEDNGTPNTVKFALSGIQHFIWCKYQNHVEIGFQYLDYYVAIYCGEILY